MQVQLAISSPIEVRDAVEGYDTWSAYCRAVVEISGRTEIRFDRLVIKDDVMVVANAVALVIFLSKLIDSQYSALEVHADVRAYGSRENDDFLIFNIDNDEKIDTISEESVKIMIRNVDRFFEDTFRSKHPDLCDFLVGHLFLA